MPLIPAPRVLTRQEQTTTYAASRRQLGPTAAAGVVVLAAALGALLAALAGRPLGVLFTGALVLGAAAGAWSVHRAYLLASVVVPPLAWLLVVAVSGLLRGLADGTPLRQAATTVAIALVTGFPALLLATLGAAAIAGTRARRSSSALRRDLGRPQVPPQLRR